MIGVELLHTALLLGGVALLAGCYGLLYAIGKFSGRRWISIAGFACYALQCALTLAVAALSPLTVPWKLVVIMGTAGFIGIPPITWIFLRRTHQH